MCFEYFVKIFPLIQLHENTFSSLIGFTSQSLKMLHIFMLHLKGRFYENLIKQIT
jgi:hypothetical protein